MGKIQNIVVGVDFSECSAVAISRALSLASQRGASVHPVHVLDTSVVTQIEAALSPMQKAIREPLIADVRKAWETFRTKVDGAAALPIEVEINNRIVGFLSHSQSVKADLIVLGAFGEKKPDVGIGTMASGCVRAAGCDVLLARDNQRGPFKSVLACVDFSDTSKRALELAADIASKDGAKLHVLHVFQGVTDVFPFFSSIVEAWVQMVAGDEQRSKAALTEFVSNVPDAALLKPVIHVVGSSTHGKALVEFARSSQADLLVLGTRGQSNIRDMLLGSTAERVLRGATCSVLAVKPRH